MIRAVDTKQLRRLWPRSEAIFRAKHRLAMAAIVARAEEADLYATALAPKAGINDDQAGSELRRFRDAGLLDEAPPPARAPGQRGKLPQLYRRRESVFWDLMPQLAEEQAPPKGKRQRKR